MHRSVAIHFLTFLFSPTYLAYFYKEEFKLIWPTFDNMIWCGNMFILHLCGTEGGINALKCFLDAAWMGFVIGKSLRMPGMIDNKKCYI